MRGLSLIGFLFCFHVALQAQTYEVKGKVIDEASDPLFDATVFVEELNVRTETDLNGHYKLSLPAGSHFIGVFSLGKSPVGMEILVNQNSTMDFQLKEIVSELETVEISGSRQQTSGISRLHAVEGFGIYEAKKNELIILDDFAANKVTNNARQIFAKVPGLNIWESDFAGLQLDIAARGLGPNRTANFNTRQNGYDMSADALGYPESYYTPAMQAVERIEIVRGAASLQYGTQFGGMLNFVMKDGGKKPVEVNLEQSVGSFGLWNTFASVGGTVNKIKYYSYYQYRTGDGWRENSEFDAHLAFASIKYQPGERLRLGVEYSFLDYLARQPGGLTDFDFKNSDIEEARRKRNWFNVSWHLLAGTLDYRFNDQTKVNLRTFGLSSGRDALGNLAQIDRLDNPDDNRTLIRDRFNNFGMETRLLHHANLWGKKSALLVGGRYYDGLTERGQGNASASSNADFNYLNPESLEDFRYDFPSLNYAVFSENILNINHKFSITPGVRFEWIRTDASGYWKQTVRDFAGNIEAQNVFSEDNSVNRSFFLAGIGLSYYLKEDLNLYANYSGNFRSVTFSDLRLNNPNFVLDSLITDERGYNMDLGLRGQLFDWMSVDLSLFLMRYNDRIGLILPAGSTLLLRTNVGDSRHIGLESFYEFDIYRLFGIHLKDQRLSIFTNLSLINAVYIKSEDSSIEGKKVEYVPDVMLRAGVNYQWKDLKATYQYSYMGEQFSDGTNSVFNPSALTGKIPAYQVMDFSLEYTPDRYKITAGVNNLTKEQYFTRRAEGYPGPGIIPATIRSFYLSFGVKL